jgi:hypothetical protein
MTWATSAHGSKNMKLSGAAMSVANACLAESVNTAIAKRKADREAEPKRRGAHSLMTDAQILEARALSEFAGWSRASLEERFGVDTATMKRVLSGVTRSRLVASRKHLPADVEAV